VTGSSRFICLSYASAGAFTCSIRDARPQNIDRVKYLGKFKTALKFYRLALRHSSNFLTGRERDDFLANLYHNLGGLEHSRRRFRRGELYARKSVLLRRRATEPSALALAADRVALAAILDGLCKFSESQNLYRQALRVYRRVYGPSRQEIALI
jgi:tetratricopeptide (TPR) repeat protein